MSDKSDEQYESIARGLANGCMYLNEGFIPKKRNIRLRKTSVRVSTIEIVWIVILTIICFVLLYCISLALSWIPGISQFISPLMISFVFAPLLGWRWGKKAANLSPYKRTTGEGMATYLMVQSSRMTPFLGRFVGRPVATNMVMTWGTGNKLVVLGVEWIGTARATRMPKRDPRDTQEQANTRAQLSTPPLCEPVNWVDHTPYSDAGESW